MLNPNDAQICSKSDKNNRVPNKFPYSKNFDIIFIMETVNVSSFLEV